MESEKKKVLKGKEKCPHCGEAVAYTASESEWTVDCPKCGKRITLCTKCRWLHPDKDERPCGDCLMCDLVNFMNYLKGKCTAEAFLSSMNPPLTDMTSGIPDGGTATLENYMDDAFGDDVCWDVKYWDIYRMVKECFLNAESSELECLEFVSEIVNKNKS